MKTVPHRRIYYTCIYSALLTLSLWCVTDRGDLVSHEILNSLTEELFDEEERSDTTDHAGGDCLIARELKSIRRHIRVRV